MARRRRGGKRLTIAKSSKQADEFFSTEIVAQGSAFALFNKKDQREIRKAGVDAAASYFIIERLPLRFTDFIRQSPFNYQLGRSDRNPNPLTSRGTLKIVVMESAKEYRVTGTANGAKATMRIRPYSSSGSLAQRKSITRVLGIVTEQEQTQMADEVADAMKAKINSGETTRKGRRRLARGN